MFCPRRQNVGVHVLRAKPVLTRTPIRRKKRTKKFGRTLSGVQAFPFYPHPTPRRRGVQSLFYSVRKIRIFGVLAHARKEIHFFHFFLCYLFVRWGSYSIVFPLFSVVLRFRSSVGVYHVRTPSAVPVWG